MRRRLRPVTRWRPVCVSLIVAAVFALGVAITLVPGLVRLESLAVAGIHASLVEPALNVAFLNITELGSNHGLLFGTLLGIGALMAARRWRGALTLALAVPLTQGTVALLKLLVERPRPDADSAVASASGFSFPSGHSAGTMALYTTLGYVLMRELRGPVRSVVAAVAALLVLAVGMSRIYLGLHYPTDVLAGWLTAAAFIIVTWSLAARLLSARTA